MKPELISEMTPSEVQPWTGTPALDPQPDDGDREHEAQGGQQHAGQAHQPRAAAGCRR